MKQEERNRLTRTRIMAAARAEFGEKSYAEASVNAICADGGISKGLLYHNFPDKEHIYLACVQDCFQTIVEYLTAHVPPASGNIGTDLNNYFEARLAFFAKKPDYQNVFYQVSSSQPQHLREAVAEIRKPIDRFNSNMLMGILRQGKLRAGLTVQEVADLHMIYQTYVNSTERMRIATAEGPQAREALAMRWINILLHGVLED